MESVEVELLTDGGSNAVVQMPGRAFPGVVVQGDTLFSLLSLARAIATETPNSDSAVSLVEELAAMLARYETALHAHGIRKPYADAG